MKKVWMVMAILLTYQSMAAVIVDSGVYSGTASSEFNVNYPVSNLFDSNLSTQWAIEGSALNNPQGRDEGWISVTLSKTYNIDAIRFAPRAASGVVDGIDTLNVWISETPFGVDVTSAASTAAFLGGASAADLVAGPFGSAADADYSLGSTVRGRYILAQFVNTTDTDINRNLGGRTFLIDGEVAVPEPGIFGLTATACGLLLAVRRKLQRQPCR